MIPRVGNVKKRSHYYMTVLRVRTKSTLKLQPWLAQRQWYDDCLSGLGHSHRSTIPSKQSTQNVIRDLVRRCDSSNRGVRGIPKKSMKQAETYQGRGALTLISLLYTAIWEFPV